MRSFSRSALAAIAAAAVSVLSGTAVHGSPVALENFSFETPDVANGTYGNGAVDGWTLSYTISTSYAKGPCDPNGGISFGAGGLLPGTGDGTQVAWFDMNENPAGRYAQVEYSSTSNPLPAFEAGGVYTLTFSGGTNDGQYAAATRYYATLLADGQPVGTETELDVPENASNRGYGTFYDVTYTYTATAADAAKTMGIRLRAKAAYTHAYFDNVRLDAVVPEPASLAIPASALAIAALRRRRARAHS